MTSVSIHKEQSEDDMERYRAVAGSHQSVGRTPGEALDALNAELGSAESSSLVVVQQMRPDAYFTEDQYVRLSDLLERNAELTCAEREELERLVREELLASARRAEALADALGR